MRSTLFGPLVKLIVRVKMSPLLILFRVQVLYLVAFFMVMLDRLHLVREVLAGLHSLVEFANSFMEFVLEVHLDNADQSGQHYEFNS